MGVKSTKGKLDEDIVYKKASTVDRKRYEELFGKVIRVGREDYRVIYCTDLKEKNSDDNYEKLDGLCCLLDKVMLINISFGERYSLLTLVHEIAHAELFESCIVLADNFPRELEEPLVELWARSSVSFLEHFAKLAKRASC